MSHWKYGKKGDKNHRRELFNIEPYMILDPDEMDCTIAYMSQGLEDLFGYWRAWALGRHFRFLPLDQEVSEVLGGVEALQWGVDAREAGTEPGRIEEFCYNQGQKDQRRGDEADEACRPNGGGETDGGNGRTWTSEAERGAMDSASHMLSLLRLYSVKTKQPIWCCIYLRHVWLQDREGSTLHQG
ncbi:Hypothetical protein (Fragment) [Durusdinium trenchii]|uniref:PAS domain-containing protein n=1 Tax=Durusdinium trenchii TaxID=1381693 RepID=A0ABP0S692_9DINO